MKAPLVSVIAVFITVAVMILSSAIAASGNPTVGPSTGSSRADSSHTGIVVPTDANEVAGISLPGSARVSSSSPAFVNCSQGNRAIVVAPTTGYIHDTLLNDYDTLGAAGGGTLELGPGVFSLNETLDLAKYGNVSIEGAGMGRTIVSLPPFPIGNFTADNGTPVGLFNATLGGPVNGVSANLIQVGGGVPIDGFEMCDLTLDAQANSASEDWSGSLIMDSSGGLHHLYTDVAEDGFFGPSTTPNGLHLESSPNGHSPAVGYVVDNLYASNNTVPFENYSNFRGGPNFLNVGAIVNCSLDNVSGIGLVAFEVAPPHGCSIANWNITGHMLVDPSTGGSWGGTTFRNVTVDSNGTAAPNALGISVANGTAPGSSNFTGLRWVDDRFYGTVLNGVNLVDVENSTFEGGLNSTPATFEGNLVVWGGVLCPQEPALPIRVDGLPNGPPSSVFTGNTFIFPYGTGSRDPFELTVQYDSWSNDTIEISGSTNGYVLSAPGIAIAPYSSFSGITYDSLGNSSPSDLVLLDLVGSPGFEDQGAIVGSLTRIYSDLPELVPPPPEGLTGTPIGPTEVTLSWNASSGAVTNYTVLAGVNDSSLMPVASVGVETSQLVTGLSPGTDQYFSVEAWNSTLHSALAPPVQVSTPPLPDHAPSVPRDLAVTSVGTTEVGLRWDPSTGNVTNYTVTMGTSTSSLTTQFSAGAVTSFSVGGLTPNTTYYFAVEAWNASWPSGPGNLVNATTLAATAVISSPGPSGAGGGSMSLFEWALVLGTLVGVAGAVVLPLLFVSWMKARARPRASRRSDPRRNAQMHRS